MNVLYLIITYSLMLMHAGAVQPSKLQCCHLIQTLAKAVNAGDQLSKKCDSVDLQGFLCEPALHTRVLCKPACFLTWLLLKHLQFLCLQLGRVYISSAPPDFRVKFLDVQGTQSPKKWNGSITWNGTSTNTMSNWLKPLRGPFPIHTAE